MTGRQWFGLRALRIKVQTTLQQLRLWLRQDIGREAPLPVFVQTASRVLPCSDPHGPTWRCLWLGEPIRASSSHSMSNISCESRRKKISTREWSLGALSPGVKDRDVFLNVREFYLALGVPVSVSFFLINAFIFYSLSTCFVTR